MATSPNQHQSRIDALMEEASQALVLRKYFDAEAVALEALRKAHSIRDYDRMARILLPLQEARRQKRDLAVDASHFVLVDGEPPTGRALVAGCYLVAPPRVGVDGRALRDACDKKKVPAIVLVREPTTRDGLWPIVALGPVTIRTKVRPPRHTVAPAHTPPAPATPRAGSGKRGKAEKGAHAIPSLPDYTLDPLPDAQWFLHAAEALGDAAIRMVPETAGIAARVDALMELIESHPNHEKLHQRLHDAARQAAREPVHARRPAPAVVVDEDDDEDM